MQKELSNLGNLQGTFGTETLLNCLKQLDQFTVSMDVYACAKISVIAQFTVDIFQI